MALDLTWKRKQSRKRSIKMPIHLNAANLSPIRARPAPAGSGPIVFPGSGCPVGMNRSILSEGVEVRLPAPPPDW